VGVRVGVAYLRNKLALGIGAVTRANEKEKTKEIK